MVRTGSIHPADLLSALRHRKSLVFTSGALIAAVSFFIVTVLPLQYSSEGALVVASGQPDIPEFGVATAFSSSTSEAVPTLIDIMHSKGFLAEVVQKLDLGNAANLRPATRLPPVVEGYLALVKERLVRLMDLMPRMGAEPTHHAERDGDASAIAYVQTHLKIESGEHSNMISIKFTGGDPALSASIVNGVMERYIANDQASRQAQAVLANQVLSGRANDLRAELEALDRQIANFLAAHDIDKVQGGSVAALQSSNTQAQLANARQVLARQQAALDTARQMTARSGNAASANEALASPVIQALMQREADLSQRIAGTLLYPDRIRLEDQLRSVRSQISSATDKIVTAAARDVDIAKANVRDLEQAAEDAKLQARGSSAAEVYIGQLTRDAEAKRQLYNSFVTRADQTRLASANFSSTRILFPASAPRLPDSPHRVIALILGFLGGAILAIAVIVFMHFFRNRVDSARDIMQATGLSVFGSLPEVKKSSIRRGSLLASGKEQSRIHETLRAIWLAVRTSNGGSNCKILLVTSSDVGEGKSTVATALARRVAADGFRVLLIGADLRRPSVVTAATGLSPGRLELLLAGQLGLEEAVMYDATSGLHCLLAAGGSENPVKLLTSNDFSTLLAKIRDSYDFVVLDSPPVLRVADAVLLSEMADLVLFVVRSGRMSADMVAEAIRRFPVELQSRILALITRVPPGRLDQRDYYGGYGDDPATATLWPSGGNSLTLLQGGGTAGRAQLPDSDARQNDQPRPLEEIA